MSIGWAIIINGIIGAIIYIPAVAIFQRLMYYKYGKDESDKGFDDAMGMSDIGYDYLSNSDDTKIPMLKAASWMITIFLWEIALPIIFTMIHDTIKSRYKK